MPLDPQVKALLATMDAEGGKSFEAMSVPEVRQEVMAWRELQGPPEPVAEVHDLTVPGPAGELPVRIFVPEGDGPLAVLLYIHGGGWVFGNLEVAEPSCRALANATGCIVVATQYRLAPETKYPGAVEDCYAALLWTAEHADGFGGDAERIGITGDSAGGNLSAAVALMARDRSGPALRCQILVYPATALDLDGDMPSRRENAEGYVLSSAAVEWCVGNYLRDPGDALEPYASPLHAADHSGLPPALIVTAEYDPLRDEGEAHGERLRAAGVEVTVSRYDGMVHGFYWMLGEVDRSRDLYREIGDFARTALLTATEHA
jgi:acetyl esterase